MNKPQQRYENIAMEQNKSSTKLQKKSFQFHNWKEQTRVNKSLMEPKQHIIK